MARFDPIMDVVKSLCLRSGDTLMRNKGLYLDCSKDVWLDMNLSSVKLAKREIFKINKRTNSVEMPCSFLQVSSVNIQDHRGVFHPVFRNDRLSQDIIEVGSVKDCSCEHKCGYKLCNTIKGYEAVTSVKTDNLPNGNPVSFACVDRKAVDSNGFLYIETQYPLRVYEDGVWTNTILHTENKKLCKVEVDTNGCICDTEENINNICSACGIHDLGTDLNPTPVPVGGNSSNSPHNSPNADTWIYYCSTKMDWFSMQCGRHPHGFREGCNNIYNINEAGNRLIFPPNFGFDKVMVRYYEDISLKNIQIPIIAKPTFMKGLQFFSVTHNDKKQQLAQLYKQEYAALKWGLLLELNKYRIKEMRMIMTPPVYVPSYIDHRRDNRGYYQ